MMVLVRAVLLGAGLALVTHGLEWAHGLFGYELAFTREDDIVLSLALLIGFRHWIKG